MIKPTAECVINCLMGLHAISASALQAAGRGTMSAGEAEEVHQEAAEAEAVLQRAWAARVGLPQLCITQRVGTECPFAPREVPQEHCNVGIQLERHVIRFCSKQHCPEAEVNWCPAANGSGPGCVVWGAGVALAEFLNRHLEEGQIRGQSVLELGAGPGTAGIAAALRGAHVLLTDRDVELLRCNVDAHARAISQAGMCRISPGSVVVAGHALRGLGKKSNT